MFHSFGSLVTSTNTENNKWTFDMAVKTEMKTGKTDQNYTFIYCSKKKTHKLKFGPTSLRSAYA